MLSFLVLVVVGAALVAPTRAILCDTDETLADLQEYTFTLPKSPSNMLYWRTYHLSYMLYGEFSEFKGNSAQDTKIEVGYYTSDDSLIYSATIDCASDSWSTQVTGTDGSVEQRLSGSLETTCEEGDIFDVWFKVQQAYMMNWMFDAQGLQNGTQTTENNGRERERPYNVTTLYGAGEAAKFKVKTTGTAILTRFAFGKCITWPVSLDDNCTAADEFIEARSKASEVGLGQFGANNVLFSLDCVNTIYYNWLQSTLHPDRDSSYGAAYCCCVYMETGKLYDLDCSTKDTCRELYCTEDWLNACTRTCVAETYNSTLIG